MNLQSLDLPVFRPYERLTLSYGDFGPNEEDVPVLLWVPNIDEPAHDHIVFVQEAAVSILSVLGYFCAPQPVYSKTVLPTLRPKERLSIHLGYEECALFYCAYAPKHPEQKIVLISDTVPLMREWFRLFLNRGTRLS